MMKKRSRIFDDDPYVIGAIGAVPTPTIADALEAIAETLAMDPTEEGQHSAMLLTQAAHRIRFLERELEAIKGKAKR